MESIPAQVNSGCAADRHSQRAAWCPGRVFSGSSSLHMNAPVFESTGLITTLKIMVGHKCTFLIFSTAAIRRSQSTVSHTKRRPPTHGAALHERAQKATRHSLPGMGASPEGRRQKLLPRCKRGFLSTASSKLVLSSPGRTWVLTGP